MAAARSARWPRNIEEHRSAAARVTFAPTVVIQGIATPATNQAIITQLGPLFAQWLKAQGWKPA
jgi:hypothetical protein